MNGLDLAAALLRLALGTVMVVHGLGHALAGGRLAGTAHWFESIGLRPGRIHAIAATLTEAGSGVSLLTGAFTPVAAAALLATMAVAYITSHRNHGFFIYNPGQGWEYVAVLAVAALALSALGPGKWSVDHAFGWELAALPAFGLTAGLGVGSAALFLMATWRPESEA